MVEKSGTGITFVHSEKQNTAKNSIKWYFCFSRCMLFSVYSLLMHDFSISSTMTLPKALVSLRLIDRQKKFRARYAGFIPKFAFFIETNFKMCSYK